MKCFQLLCWALAAMSALVGCSRSPLSEQNSTDTPQSDFIEAFRRAHDTRDAEAMRKLFCWDGATPEVRESTERNSYAFEEKIVIIKMTSEHPAGRVNEFTKDGISYAFNLPATSELVVELEPLTRGASNTNSYPVGFKDGHYLITLMAPKPR
jgi:hypothetical protein